MAVAGEAQSDSWPLVHFGQVSVCWCCPHVQKQTCTSGRSWEATEEKPLEDCMLIGSSSSVAQQWALRGPGQDSMHGPLGGPGAWGCGEAAAPSGCWCSFPRQHHGCCRLHRRKTDIPYPISLFSSLHFPSLPFLFCPLLFSFVVPPILSLSSLSLFFLSRLLSPPHPPFLLFSVLSTSDPHAITPAGSSSPGGCRGCVTDAPDQQGAVAQARALAPSSASGKLEPQLAQELVKPRCAAALPCHPTTSTSLPPGVGSSPWGKHGVSARRRQCASAACHSTHDHLALGDNHKPLSGFGPLL